VNDHVPNQLGVTDGEAKHGKSPGTATVERGVRYLQGSHQSGDLIANPVDSEVRWISGHAGARETWHVKSKHSEFVRQIFGDTFERCAVTLSGRDKNNIGPLAPLLAVPVYSARAMDE